MIAAQIFLMHFGFAQDCTQSKSGFGPYGTAYLEFAPLAIDLTADYEILIDNSKPASKRRATTSSDYSSMKKPSSILVKSHSKPFTMDFYFKFSGIGYAVIRNLDFRVFFPSKLKKSGDSQASCVQKLKTHLGEYERRALIFSTKKIPDALDANLLASMGVQRELNFDFMVVTNNCRSPGAFEYEIPGHSKGYFQFPIEKYRQLYSQYDQQYSCRDKQWQDFDFNEARTEYRVSRFYDNGRQGVRQSFKDHLVWLWSKIFEDDFQWYSLGDFEAVTCPLSDLTSVYNFTAPKTEVKFVRASGRINYDEFPSETAMKSNFVRTLEALSYVKTPCQPVKENPPEGLDMLFRFQHLSVEEFWNSGRCLIISNLFRNWDDLEKYDVFLSRFEIDGVYSGRSRKLFPEEEKNFNTKILTSEKDRVPYFFKNWIGKFKKAYLENQNGKLVLKLENEQGFDFVIANIDLEALTAEYTPARVKTNFKAIHHYHHLVRGLDSLVGLAPRNLTNLANSLKDEFESERSLVSFFIDRKSGKVLNHHDPKIGIEQFIVRLNDKKLTLDLISHERIMPVARYELDCEFCHL